MQILGAFEAKTHFSSLLDQVEKGEQVIITKHGHPVAKLISIKTPDKEGMRLAIKRLKAFNKTNQLGELDWKALRDEGRK
jgi:prevent-host-death family protein